MMKWLSQFDLILFDFDGLLVNTEKTHYRAYCELFKRHGVRFTWDFARYCQAAHYSATALQEAAKELYPELIAQVGWPNLYAEKKAIQMELVDQGELELMPYVDQLLQNLPHYPVQTCVVTHSSKVSINQVRGILPQLNNIRHWITREDYQNPKPAPDPYLHALKLYAERGNRVIGFEDTVRGVGALARAFKEFSLPLQSRAVLVAESRPDGIDALIKETGYPIAYSSSFREIA
jgi:beta-phosphoglucomutase